jgi:predicted phosphodiesterase
MKIAAISDIHGNLAALEAVIDHVDTFRPDLVLVVGDIINRGPLSVPCWELVRERVARDGWRLLYGNHEEYVLDCLRTEDPHRPATYWTVLQMGRKRMRDILPLPYSLVVPAPDGSELRAYHGSVRHTRDGIYPWTTDKALRKMVDPAASIFVTAHTHRPLLRWLAGLPVVNCGSVGAPFDGDVRASYAQITWRSGRWAADIVRVPYDRARADADFHDTGFFFVEPVAQVHFYEWYYARPLYPYWERDYATRVQAGELSGTAALHEFIREMGLPENHLVP